jgi:eukaryotic translation initiation factor 2C
MRLILRLGTFQEVKRYAETNMGAITQCMLSKHLFAAKYAYIANLALKINVKLGGSNFYIV